MKLLCSMLLVGIVSICLLSKADERHTTGNVPIEFYGKVVDQDGNPLPNAVITFEQQAGHMTSATSGYISHDHVIVQSDKNGEVIVSHTKGIHLILLSIDKPGYGLSKKAEHWFSYNNSAAIYHPNPNTPVVFKMWKIRGKERLISVKWEGIISCDGTTNKFNLATGRHSNSGDLQIICRRSPLKLNGANKPFDYCIKVEIIDGSIQATSDEFTYLAPDNGYEPQFVEDKRADERGWRGNFTQEFYIKTPDGHFGQLIINWYSWQHGQTHLDWNCVINPSGSRNLER